MPTSLRGSPAGHGHCAERTGENPVKTNLALYATAMAILAAILFWLRLGPFAEVPRSMECPPLIPADVEFPRDVEILDLGAKAEVTVERATGFKSVNPSFLAMLVGRGRARFERGNYDAVATWTSGDRSMLLLRREDQYAWVSGQHAQLIDADK